MYLPVTNSILKPDFVCASSDIKLMNISLPVDMTVWDEVPVNRVIMGAIMSFKKSNVRGIARVRCTMHQDEHQT